MKRKSAKQKKTKYRKCCVSVTQWQSSRLLIDKLWVRIPSDTFEKKFDFFKNLCYNIYIKNIDNLII